VSQIQEKKANYQYTGYEEHVAEYAPSLHQQMYEQATGLTENIDQESWIGFTSYDLQTNAAPKHRLHGKNGGVSAVWTHHPETSDPATTFPNRGSGYNNNFESPFSQSVPNGRLEATTRTGWCNVVVTDTGRELVMSHSANNEIIVIALTVPEGNGGTAFNGQDGALLYFRSMDGGDTWDVQDFQVPGIGMESFFDIDGDSYGLTANGSTVAFTLFNGFADVVTVISEDNGQTWNKRIVNDFPLDLYVPDSGYTFEDIGGVVDPDAPDSLAILTSDGSGSVYIGPDGTVHVAYGRMYVIDTELTDGFTNFFPGTTGIVYWNSTMADGAITLIDPVFDAIDINGNDTLEVADDLPSYGGSLTSMVDLIVADDGNIILAYAQHMENFVRPAIAGSANFPESQNYRHIYLTASNDNGTTWQEPYDVQNPSVLLFPGLLSTTEAVFPHLYADGSEMVDITYQVDSEPGIFVYNDNGGDNDPVANNTIAHWRFDMFEIFPGLSSVSVDVAPVETFKFSVTPNPAIDNVNISYKLPSSARTQVVVSNIVGQQVMVRDNGTQAEGIHNLELNVANLAKGAYIVSLRTDDKVSSQRLVVTK